MFIASFGSITRVGYVVTSHWKVIPRACKKLYAKKMGLFLDLRVGTNAYELFLPSGMTIDCV